jgi:hypothetical protein
MEGRVKTVSLNLEDALSELAVSNLALLVYIKLKIKFNLSEQQQREAHVRGQLKLDLRGGSVG